MGVFVTKLLDTSDFPPRWMCGNWTDVHGWIHIGSDLLIWGAYYAIPCVLVHFIRKRPDAPFPRIFWLFGAFIFACGTVHLIEAVIFWHPIYRVSAVLKAMTAVVSWVTVVALLPIVPRALALPGIEALNEQLRAEIEQKQAIEERLRAESSELSAANADLRTFVDRSVGRELRMVELKREVNELLARCDEPPRYTIADDAPDEPLGPPDEDERR